MKSLRLWPQGKAPWNKGQGYISFVPSAYRVVAFVIAVVQVFSLSPTYQPTVSPVALITGIGIYTLVKVLHPPKWNQPRKLGHSLLAIDIAVCFTLLMLTGGVLSPYLLYTLTPVLTAALLLDAKVTAAIAVLSVAYVNISHFANPFVATSLSLAKLSYITIYSIAVGLIATLPYLTNVNFRQRLQAEDIIRERQRLSREIHDGSAQTLSALRWQVQLLNRRLTKLGVDLVEVDQLERLIDKANRETRDSIELLRSYTGGSSLMPYCRQYLHGLNGETDIRFRVDIDTDEVKLPLTAELELLRICQEAVSNIRKHSGASEAHIKLNTTNGRVQLSISDNGSGFDATTFYHGGATSGGHGLEIMRERTESIGGQMRVLSMPGMGTEVQVETPSKFPRGRLPWAKR